MAVYRGRLRFVSWLLDSRSSLKRTFLGLGLVALSCHIDPRIVEERERAAMQGTGHSGSGGQWRPSMPGSSGRGGQPTVPTGGAGGMPSGGMPSSGGAPAVCGPELEFDTPIPLTDLDVGRASVASLWLTPDELTTYFVSDLAQDQGLLTANNIWTASRVSRAAPFGPPTLVEGVNGQLYPYAVALSADQLDLYATVNMRGSGTCGLCEELQRAVHYRRSNITAGFGEGVVVQAASVVHSPWLSRDGQRLYFSDTGAVSMLDLSLGTPPQVVPNSGAFDSGLDFYALVLSSDELTMIGSTDQLQLTVRTGFDQPFAAPRSLGPDAEPWVYRPAYLVENCTRLYLLVGTPPKPFVAERRNPN